MSSKLKISQNSLNHTHTVIQSSSSSSPRGSQKKLLARQVSPATVVPRKLLHDKDKGNGRDLELDQESDVNEQDSVSDFGDLDDQLPKLLKSLRHELKDDKADMRKDDEFLTKFIRVRDYDLGRATKSVRNYYQNVEKHAELIRDIRPSQFAELYDAKIVTALKERCKIGSFVPICQITNWDAKIHSVHQIQQATLFQIEEINKDKSTQRNGISMIFDMQNLSFSHLRQLTPKDLQVLVMFAQDGFPIKIIGLHFINYPAIFWGIFYIARSFMKEKLRKRIHFHSNFKSLHTFFREETLPKFLGGPLENEDAIDQDVVAELLKNDIKYDEYFQPQNPTCETKIKLPL